jgi:RNA processing factor Prp31
MTDTAKHLVPEQGKLRRALAAVLAWAEAMDYSSFDYTRDRIDHLEREVEQLKEELRQRDEQVTAVRSGSFADIGQHKTHVCFVPKSVRPSQRGGRAGDSRRLGRV